MKNQGKNFDFSESRFGQGTFFDLLQDESSTRRANMSTIDKQILQPRKFRSEYFQLHNRRYLGNKYKLLNFIEAIISEKCGNIASFCDIFAGTGVVGERFNHQDIKVISNDFLSANYICLQAFLKTGEDIGKKIIKKIDYLNNLKSNQSNYFSEHFGGTYFSKENANKIGFVREEIDEIAENQTEKNILVCSLLYAVDKVANTVGHYDAFRKKLDAVRPLKLSIPYVDCSRNQNNEVYKKDANSLIKQISCDVLYVDPPYNSRQYSGAYHLLENLVEWEKPEVIGMTKKMDCSHIKSTYCLKDAEEAFADLIVNADCRHILLSYNNTADSKDGRSNARMRDDVILQILHSKGNVKIFEKDYKAFTTGKSDTKGNTERIFYCKTRSQQ